MADRLDTCVITDRAAAEHYVAKVCFKTGPPSRIGVELEWIMHDRDDPARPIDPVVLAAALGDHAPSTLQPDSPALPLPHGGVVTVEPGGQVELSTPPYESPAALFQAVLADQAHLTAMLATAGLVLGDEARDVHRPGHVARRILHTPRYAAMEHAYDRRGPHGRTMMCRTAGLQVCLDIGTAERAAARWRAAHAIGPALLASFANPHRRNGRDGWASERMRTWYGLDPALTRGPPIEPDPAAGWARRALDAPLLVLRRERQAWHAPPGVTFADWIAGALPRMPTYDDLDYHLSTLFPLVRPRGYLELRYLDAQPGTRWQVPAAVVAALFADERTVDAAVGSVGGTADRWVPAARDGLADPALRRAARALLDLACRALPQTGLPPSTIAAVTEFTAAVDHHPHLGASR
jgi:glutamate--cysteine ligase